ncbi:MAG: HAD family phosphatase [Planctomycetes bacterium]|nr:HAD family phosphatase [Planctomycetota bacterium]
MTPFLAYVFDLDGVIVDTSEVKADLFAELFPETPERRDDIRAMHFRFGGVNRREKFQLMARETLGRPLAPDDLDRRVAAFSRLAPERVRLAPWIPGAEETLRRLSARVPLALSSGTDHAEVVDLIAFRGIAGCFVEAAGFPTAKAQVARRMLDRVKPDSPARVAFVGDAPQDRIAAEETGLTFILRESEYNRPLFAAYNGPRVPDLRGLGA